MRITKGIKPNNINCRNKLTKEKKRINSLGKNSKKKMVTKGKRSCTYYGEIVPFTISYSLNLNPLVFHFFFQKKKKNVIQKSSIKMPIFPAYKDKCNMQYSINLLSFRSSYLRQAFSHIFVFFFQTHSFVVVFSS